MSGGIVMRYYEKDILNIPKRYKKLSHEQIERKIKFWGKVGKIINKFDSIFSPKRKKKTTNSKVKFYL